MLHICERAANPIFDRIGRIAHKEMVLHPLQAKCMTVLSYGLEACPQIKVGLNSLDFVVNGFS